MLTFIHLAEYAELVSILNILKHKQFYYEESQSSKQHNSHSGNVDNKSKTPISVTGILSHSQLEIISKVLNLIDSKKTADKINPSDLVEQMSVFVKNIGLVNVTSAFNLSDFLRSDIEDMLKNLDFAANKVVLIDYSIDRSLVSGFCVEINGRYLDFSLKNIFNEILVI